MFERTSQVVNVCSYSTLFSMKRAIRFLALLVAVGLVSFWFVLAARPADAAGPYTANDPPTKQRSVRDSNDQSDKNNDGEPGKRPSDGSVGNADDKNPKGQMPGGSDSNKGYECDKNNGVGKGNPAHSGCKPPPPPPPPPCVKDCNPPPPPPGCKKDCSPKPPTPPKPPVTPPVTPPKPPTVTPPTPPAPAAVVKPPVVGGLTELPATGLTQTMLFIGILTILVGYGLKRASRR